MAIVIEGMIVLEIKALYCYFSFKQFAKQNTDGLLRYLYHTQSIWLGIQFRQRYTHEKESKLKKNKKNGFAGP